MKAMQMTAMRDRTPGTSEEGSILIPTALAMRHFIGRRGTLNRCLLRIRPAEQVGGRRDAAAKSAALEVNRATAQTSPASPVRR